MWLLRTNSPKTRSQANSWDNAESDMDKLNMDRGMNVKDQWWWNFRTKKDAEKAKTILRAKNQGNGMKLYLRQVTEMPPGWE